MAKKIKKTDIENIISLSPLQEGILFHYLLDVKSEVYCEQLTINISMKINYDIFVKSWEMVVRDNSTLRTIFRWEDIKNPIQIILKNYKSNIELHDCTTNILEKNRIKENDHLKRFDLEKIPFRVLLCKLSEENHEIIISFHHILLDGWSTGIIIKEFFENYNLLSNNQEIPVRQKAQYEQYIEHLQRLDNKRTLEFWQEYLQDLETCRLSNISFNESPQKNICDYDKEHFAYDRLGLDSILKKYGISKATIIYGTWALLLSRYTNSTEVCFGTTISGRNIEIDNIENTAGLFINTLPLFSKADPSIKLIDFLKNVQNDLSNREEFENISLSDIISVTKNKTSSIFDTIVVIENYPIGKELNSSSKFIVNS
ncbi:MAG: non-ribosomal peptide synthetase, partial [Candidatus Delongbacteria bacterium]|nr:non-ribosomal peptide synthetase [Candidatus Delongbacteria bacterium]